MLQYQANSLLYEGLQVLGLKRSSLKALQVLVHLPFLYLSRGMSIVIIIQSNYSYSFLATHDVPNEADSASLIRGQVELA